MKKMLALKALIGVFALLFFSFNSVPFTALEKELSRDVTTINGSPVVFVQVVHLEGENERPVPVETDAKGIAILRMTADKILYAKVMVHKMDPEDGTLLASHIHTGSADVAGPVLVPLAIGAENFGKTIVVDLSTTPEKYEAILTDELYVNAHSSTYPGGIVRGQIR